jgi:hypothetical protein
MDHDRIIYYEEENLNCSQHDDFDLYTLFTQNDSYPCSPRHQLFGPQLSYTATHNDYFDQIAAQIEFQMEKPVPVPVSPSNAGQQYSECVEPRVEAYNGEAGHMAENEADTDDYPYPPHVVPEVQRPRGKGILIESSPEEQMKRWMDKNNDIKFILRSYTSDNGLKFPNKFKKSDCEELFKTAKARTEFKEWFEALGKTYFEQKKKVLVPYDQFESMKPKIFIKVMKYCNAQ